VSPSAGGSPPLQGVGEAAPKTTHTTRLLAGFMHPDQSVRTVHWEQTPQAQTELRRQLEARCQAVARRADFHPAEVITRGERRVLDEAATRTDLQNAFKDQRWSLEWVDMRKVVAVQREVITDGLEQRVRDAAEDEAALLELCIPEAPESADVEFNLDPDRRGITLVSPNPNLRLTGLRHQTGAVVIRFGIPSGHITVAKFRGRHYLRNGYHRVAGLLRAGVTRIPAVVTEVDTFENMVVGDGGFGGEIVGWRVPPLLTDFWDESVSIASAHPIRRSGYHIRADEIRLPA
jgi:hypothetical protein